MPYVAADWSINRSTKNIRYIGSDHGVGSPSYCTTIELHRALQDYADNASTTGDDELDITDNTPSERSTDNIITLINGYNIDDNAAEHIYDGSIVQSSGNVIYDGIKVLAPAGTKVQIIQNGAVLADDWWNSGTGLNPDTANGVSHNFMLKVRTGGTDIDGRRFVATTREWGKTYLEFKINGTSRGLNVVALATGTDLNNSTAIGTIAAIADISNLSEGYNGMDVNNDTVNEFYYSKWDRGANTINRFYERMKWLTRDGSVSTLYGLNGEVFRGITHELTVDGGSGTWSAYEAVSWSGGTGQLLARNNATATSCTKLWIQLLTGVPPTDNQTVTGGTSGATNLVNVTVTERAISAPFCGVSTGSSIIGSYGFGIEAGDLSASDKVFDLTNTQITPPNNVTFSVTGLVVGDRVLVGPDDGSGNLQYNQMAINTTLNTDNIVSVVVSSAIPLDTPSSGYIRVRDNNGKYRRLHYTSYTGSTFTVNTTDGNEDFASVNATAGNNVFVAYIDAQTASTSESFSVIYVSPRSLFIRVRDGGATPIKTFETVGTLGSSGGSTTAIRTSDL